MHLAINSLFTRFWIDMKNLKLQGVLGGGGQGVVQKAIYFGQKVAVKYAREGKSTLSNEISVHRYDCGSGVCFSPCPQIFLTLMLPYSLSLDLFSFPLF
jgi:hypothetical protein